jgi:uncharacterized membrane protein (DUF2068 family)
MIGTPSFRPEHRQPARSRLVLRVIAVYKLLHVVVLIAFAVGAYKLMHANIADLLQKWAAAIRIKPANRLLQWSIHQLLNVDVRTFEALQIGAIVYSVLLTVEGVGLWFEKRWAEYLTIVITASLVPFEIYELAHHASWLKAAVLAVNIAIVIWLIRYVRRSR